MTTKTLLIENLNFYLILANTIFLGGLLNLLIARSPIIWLVSIELLFISSFLNFIIFSIYYYNIEGFIYSLLILILAAVESALGLSLIILFFHHNKRINIEFYKENTKYVSKNSIL